VTHAVASWKNAGSLKRLSAHSTICATHSLAKGKKRVKEGSKYYPLYTYLQQSGRDRLTLTFAELESLLSAPLPASARRQRGWWANRRGGTPAAAWLGAGYLVDELDLDAGQLTFRKAGVAAAYNVMRQGDTVLWDGALVKALREHMGLTQSQMAEELGASFPYTVTEEE
jgi:hypothetical protein